MQASVDADLLVTLGENTFSPPEVRGKFIIAGGKKLYVKGVTYGTFRPRDGGGEYPDVETVNADFSRIAANGMNTIRTYTIPPPWLLDAALQHGLRVMVGIPWEQHIIFLDDRHRARSIEQKIRAGVRACAEHPAVLCYAIGNEIPAPIVRWHGPSRIEHFLHRLYDAAKSEDENALVTYVNYPSTEYLQLPFLDFTCFNVYIESQRKLEAYLARLQNLAGDKPLVLAEVGLDSRRNGETAQATVLEWYVRSGYRSGCAGIFLFAWTDEWFRGGYDIDDWDFGLTTRTREPKPALAAVRRPFAEVPISLNGSAPRISVVVCAHNAAGTLRETLEAVLHLNYPNYEVILVDDGSSDATPSIALQCGVRIVTTENRGLSSARNTGLEAATGEIVAYIDADAYPDPDWLTFLAFTFMNSTHAGVGGPNIPPNDDGEIAQCVANAPGGPTHVLLSDWEAEHIPGCNMAFRTSCLKEIGGFDPLFRAAGDDVDVCWRLQQRGWTLGFSPAAMVWHHRRNSIAEYWKQQKGYGRAEGMLGKKWPEKYNRLGHLSWKGRLYGNGHSKFFSLNRPRIYHGTWGQGLFQSLYTPTAGRIVSLPLMPEWFYVVTALATFSLMALLWEPLAWSVPLLLIAVTLQLVPVIMSVMHANFPKHKKTKYENWKLQAITAFLHLIQPLARLAGRFEHGLTPWRRLGKFGFVLPVQHKFSIWREQWRSPEETLYSVETKLTAQGAIVFSGGDFDKWDLQVRTGTGGDAHVQMAIEEHGSGKQLARFRVWPVPSLRRLMITFVFDTIALAALIDGAWVASAVVGSIGVFLGVLTLRDCGSAIAAVLVSLKRLEQTDKS